MRDMDGRPSPAFGALLRRYRGRARLTQEQVAERAQVSERTIRNLERGTPHAPRDDTLHLLAAALDLSEEERATFVTAGQALQILHARDTSLRLGTIGSGRLPHPPTPLFGRERDLLQITAALTSGDVRLLTLVGAPGVGKTRLALAVAHSLADQVDSFADGVAFVPLASLADPALLPDALLQALGLREQGDTPPLAVVQARLAERQTLLVLDNLEHLLQAAPVLADLLAACPSLALLVTSRALLQVSGEHVYEVRPLQLPSSEPYLTLEALAMVPSVVLFVARARAVLPDFALTPTNAPVVAAICRRLDGLPLALELAAARLRLFPPEALLARLGQRLPLLTDGPRDLPTHQHTLRATLDWSYALLSEDEQALLRSMAVFSGGTTLEALEALWDMVAAQDSSLLDLLTTLVNHSLVQREQALGGGVLESGVSDDAFTGVAASDHVRMGMLEIIREYAGERLCAAGEEDTACQAHAHYFLALAEQAEPELEGSRQANWLVWLEQDHANFRAALQWSREQQAAETGLRLAGALWRFWYQRGYLGEGRAWLDEFLALAETCDPSEHAQVDVLEQDPGQEMYAAWRAKALHGAGWLAFGQGDYLGAQGYHEASLALRRQIEDRAGVAHSLNNLGGVASTLGDYAHAAALLEESLSLYRQLDDSYGIASVLHNLAGIAWAQGDYARARVLCDEELVLRRRLGDSAGIARALEGLGILACELGGYREAQTFHGEGLRLARRIGDRRRIAYALYLLGDATRMQGAYSRAEVLYCAGQARFQDLGDGSGVADVQRGLGALAMARREWAQARDLFGASLQYAQEHDTKQEIAQCLEGIAGTLGRDNAEAADHDVAARLYGAAASVRAAIEAPQSPSEAVAVEEHVTQVRATLGEERFIAAWAQGEQLPLDETINSALRSVPQSSVAPAKSSL